MAIISRPRAAVISASVTPCITSLTIIVGFSILVLSILFPTMIFGLMTGLAADRALAAALTLLPRLIIIAKPFGTDF
ncbi:MAG: hypothetical protein R2860_11100 [Desulfobacterales bacterium]